MESQGNSYNKMALKGIQVLIGVAVLFHLNGPTYCENFCDIGEICTCNDAAFNALFRLVLPTVVSTMSLERINGLRRLNSDELEMSVREQLSMSNVDEHEMSHMDFQKLFESRRSRRYCLVISQ